MHDNLRYFIVDNPQGWFEKGPTEFVLFYAKNPKEPKHKYGVLKTLILPTMVGDKMVVSVKKYMGCHQDIAWFRESCNDTDLALCIEDGSVVRKDKDNKIYLYKIWD